MLKAPQSVQPARAAGRSRGVARAPLVVRAQSSQVQQASGDAPAEPSGAGGQGGDEIYLGFAKGDYAPRAGRKGRVIKDDPSKYPTKEDLGIFSGATGGWAGGEAGLWKLRDEVLAAKATKGGAGADGAAPSSPLPPPPAPEGKAPIYLGFGKYDLDARKSGAPGRVIFDDPTKYPAKEDLGFFAGATGGFAAGEKGVKQFVRDGAVVVRKEGQPGGQAGSPVAIGFLLALAGAGGGLLLNTLADAATEAIKAQLASSGAAEGTSTTVLGAAAVGGAAAILGGGFLLAASLRARLGPGADRLVLIGGASFGLFLASRAIYEL